MTDDRYEVIEKLWERSGHGTERRDIEAAYDAGFDAGRLAVQPAACVIHGPTRFVCAKCGTDVTPNDDVRSYSTTDQQSVPNLGTSIPNSETRAAMEESRRMNDPVCSCGHVMYQPPPVCNYCDNDE
jgi:hypothetical protein